MVGQTIAICSQLKRQRLYVYSVIECKTRFLAQDKFYCETLVVQHIAKYLRRRKRERDSEWYHLHSSLNSSLTCPSPESISSSVYFRDFTRYRQSAVPWLRARLHSLKSMSLRFGTRGVRRRMRSRCRLFVSVICAQLSRIAIQLAAMNHLCD